MSPHHPREELVHRVLDGASTAAEEIEVHDHLAVCRLCFERLAPLFEVSELLALPAAALVAPGRSRSPNPAAVAAAALALLFGAAWLGSRAVDSEPRPGVSSFTVDRLVFTVVREHDGRRDVERWRRTSDQRTERTVERVTADGTQRQVQTIPKHGST